MALTLVEGSARTAPPLRPPRTGSHDSMSHIRSTNPLFCDGIRLAAQSCTLDVQINILLRIPTGLSVEAQPVVRSETNQRSKFRVHVPILPCGGLLFATCQSVPAQQAHVRRGDLGMLRGCICGGLLRRNMSD